VEGLSKERLQRFFTRVDSNYLISKRIREMCVFARQNVIKDPPFSRIDLVSCRNVLIYLQPVLQDRLISFLHYALKPDGFLLLGASESIRSSLFALLDKKNKIYSRESVPSHISIEPAMEPAGFGTAELPVKPWSEVELAQEIDRILLGRYSPPGIIVDNKAKIVHCRGRTSEYLQMPPGTVTLNLFKMAREGLGPALQEMIERARREKQPIRRESVSVWRESGVAPVTLEVIPLTKAGRADHFLILFEESPKPKLGRVKRTSTTKSRESLEHQLAMVKAHLESVIERHQASDESLLSANEEIRSGNEELQSTNEELETAKEELQSTNEELTTVNDELQKKNAQLSRVGDDLVNLLSSVNIPIIMVGNDLRIRRFTPIAEKILNLIPGDVGRPITDINLKLRIPDLARLLEDVIQSLTPKALTVQDTSGREYSLRIRPYRTEDNKIDGAVIVLLDLDSKGHQTPLAQATEIGHE
jgi:two-component system, chemotaxis family, CheB/CheR fusion protein